MHNNTNNKTNYERKKKYSNSQKCKDVLPNKKKNN